MLWSGRADNVANSPSPTASPTVTATKSVTATPNPTAGWKTYKNDKQGFELKYPSNMMVLTNNYTSNDTFPDYSYISIGTDQDHAITIGVNQPGVGFEGYDILGKKTVNVGGVSAERTVMKEAGSNVWLVLFSFNRQQSGESAKDGYMIIYRVNSEAELQGNVFDQIASTFKFK